MNYKPQQILFFLLLFLVGCDQTPQKLATSNLQLPTFQTPFLVVLGIAQDAGFPQADCQKDCCKAVWKGEVSQKMVSCLALVDPQNDQFWIFDATPDFKFQLQKVKEILPEAQLSGIFLTHAHIGHYTGLMQLGREVMGAKGVPVFTMPRMKKFLENNGPWSQLVTLNNIEIQALNADSTIFLNEKFEITPLKVPHRDEFSETVGFSIKVNQKKALFIPDINKWQLWKRSITEQIQLHDIAFLDGSFYQNGEIPGRDMSEIPHPFIMESLEIFQNIPKVQKSKVNFIHFNHTNPVLKKDSKSYQNVIQNGFQIAEEGQVFVF
jgi:pyrroloquinoline quinone biosynthesis protein B